MKITMRSAMTAFALLAAGRGYGQDATAIMKKAQLSMTGMKTYQATWVMTVSMGQMGSAAINMDMKMIPASGKFAMKMSQSGTPTGMMAMSMGMMNNMQSVDDGKNSYTYIPMMNGYQKGPHNKQINMDPRKQFMQQAEYAKFKYLRTEKLAGRDVHVIEMIVDQKKAAAAAGSRTRALTPQARQLAANMPPMKMEMYVDVATGRLKQMAMHMDMGAMMGGAGGKRPAGGAQPPAMKMDMTMAVQREVIDAAIPDSAFKFTPPPGAKLIPGAPGGMGMGMPGMGGGGRPRAPR